MLHRRSLADTAAERLIASLDSKLALSVSLEHALPLGDCPRGSRGALHLIRRELEEVELACLVEVRVGRHRGMLFEDNPRLSAIGQLRQSFTTAEHIGHLRRFRWRYRDAYVLVVLISQRVATLETKFRGKHYLVGDKF